ncbi:helix-turn-helix transcriptional regulator, partial [Clostridium sp.]|uniref:helix-turn-helix transcriptional regulator n=1 Tax=Clostridium sp. TaxID=1506 RepID=UPI002633E259
VRRGGDYLSSVIKAARNLRGYTQEDLAKCIGISTRTYGRKESNPDSFTVSEIKKIAEILNVEKEIFFKNKLTVKVI